MRTQQRVVLCSSFLAVVEPGHLALFIEHGSPLQKELDNVQPAVAAGNMKLAVLDLLSVKNFRGSGCRGVEVLQQQRQ